MRSFLGSLSCLVFVASVSFGVLGSSTANADERLERIRAEHHRGDLDAALTSVDRYLGGQPDAPGALFIKGVVLADLGRTGEAEGVFERLIEIDPSSPEAYNNLAVLHAGNGNYQQAIDTLKRALGTHPSYHAAFDNLSKLYARLASDAYSRALGVRGRAEQEIPLVILREMDAPDSMRMASTTSSAATATAESASDWRPVEVESPSPPLADGAEIVEMEETSAASPAPSDSTTGDLALAIQNWADAWSNQDVDGYLGAYASGFLPDNGMSRSDWENQRRSRVAAPSWVKVSVAFLEASMEGPTSGTVRLLQSYESDRFSDKVTKFFQLVLEEGEWRILKEKVATP